MLYYFIITGFLSFDLKLLNDFVNQDKNNNLEAFCTPEIRFLRTKMELGFKVTTSSTDLFFIIDLQCKCIQYLIITEIYTLERFVAKILLQLT